MIDACLLIHFFFSQQCAPCLVPYDGILKLESHDDLAYILSRSGLGKYISSKDLSTWPHHTKGGSTPERRNEFFKDVSCTLVENLTQHFLMDLELFQYNATEFMNICKKEPTLDENLISHIHVN